MTQTITNEIFFYRFISGESLFYAKICDNENSANFNNGRTCVSNVNGKSFQTNIAYEK